jgi:hypothetical protein
LTHNTSIDWLQVLPLELLEQGVSHTSDDYAAYNRTGGVATAPAPSSTTTTGLPPVKLMRPQVKLLQDRPFGTSVAPGNATFNNSMRVGYGGIVANSNADFFKMASTKKTRSTVQMNRIWRSN